MTRRRLLLPLAAAYLLASDCSRSPVEVHAESWIVGRWAWVQSTGGLIGETRTPQTEGFVLELEFQEDGGLRVYRNGSLEASSSFEIQPSEQGALLEKGVDILGTESLLVVLVDEHLGRPEPWSQDAMLLLERCDDCFIHEFERVP